MDIIEKYHDGSIKGWAEHLAKDAWNMLRGSTTFKPFMLAGPPAGSRKSRIIEAARKVLGRDIEVRTQTIGECVSMGAVNSTEYLSCVDIAIRGDAEKYRRLFNPYCYGTGRVLVGNNQLGNSDGSCGSWMAEAISKYGVICEDDPDVPQYSASVAKQWGSSRTIINKFVELGKQHTVKSATPCKTWDDYVTGLCNGFLCSFCSNVGYEMLARQDGFHARRGAWNHCMTGIHVDDDYKEPYGLILNSWGASAHGQLKDFETGENLPVCVLRVRKKDIQAMLAQGDSYLYSTDFNGFPDQQAKLEKALFKMN